jgi:hypothetical protein
MSVSAEVATLFVDELARRNIEVKVDDDGNYAIAVNGLTMKVSLENLSRDFERDRDPDRVVSFVDTVTTLLELPDWQEAEPRVRWQLEPSDHKFGDTLRDAVSDQVALVLVYVDPSETQIRWLTSADAERWHKTRDELMAAALRNMDGLLRDAKIETTDIDEHSLGILNSEYTAFKAALLYSPNLREVVEPVVGWPLFAVMPCRDFVYVLNQEDEPLLERMGQVVLREHAQSGYPISTEVFEISDEGVRAIGAFQAPAEDEAASGPEDDVMKTIRYRGGLVTFRIPAHWTEEYEEEGGGTFYDEDNDTGTLRLSVLTFASRSPVTERTTLALLEPRRQEHNGVLTELGHGNALLRYTDEVKEDDEALTIHYWEVANVLPPNHFRVAVFSYSVATDLADDEDVLAEMAIMEEEVRACKFADELGA